VDSVSISRCNLSSSASTWCWHCSSCWRAARLSPASDLTTVLPPDNFSMYWYTRMHARKHITTAITRNVAIKSFSSFATTFFPVLFTTLCQTCSLNHLRSSMLKQKQSTRLLQHQHSDHIPYCKRISHHQMSHYSSLHPHTRTPNLCTKTFYVYNTVSDRRNAAHKRALNLKLYACTQVSPELFDHLSDWICLMSCLRHFVSQLICNYSRLSALTSIESFHAYILLKRATTLFCSPLPASVAIRNWLYCLEQYFAKAVTIPAVSTFKHHHKTVSSVIYPHLHIVLLVFRVIKFSSFYVNANM